MGAGRPRKSRRSARRSVAPCRFSTAACFAWAARSRSDGHRSGTLMKLTTLALITLLALPTSVFAQEIITIKAARILDGKRSTLTDPAIVVQGSKILRIEPRPQRVTYDLGDMTLMPGWIDTHVHIASHFD